MGRMSHSPFTSFESYEKALSSAIFTLVSRVPLLKSRCVFHGSAAASISGLRHRMSWDADFMTERLMDDTADIADQISTKFRGEMEWTQADYESHMFQGRLHLDGLPDLPFDLFRNVHDLLPIKSATKRSLNGMPVVALETYAAEKAASITERSEQKDVYDICACFRNPVARADTKRSITGLGYSAVKTLQRRIADVGTSFERFAPAIPGFDPVDAEIVEEFSTYLSIRRSQHELVRNARRMEREFSGY